MILPWQWVDHISSQPQSLTREGWAELIDRIQKDAAEEQKQIDVDTIKDLNYALAEIIRIQNPLERKWPTAKTQQTSPTPTESLGRSASEVEVTDLRGNLQKR